MHISGAAHAMCTAERTVIILTFTIALQVSSDELVTLYVAGFGRTIPSSLHILEMIDVAHSLIERWERTSFVQRWKHQQQHKNDKRDGQYQVRALKRQIRYKTRKLMHAVFSQNSRPNSPLENRLLNLPAELRLMIWKYALGGHFIAFCQNHGRICHTLLDTTNSKLTTQDLPVHVPSIQNATHQLTGTSKSARKSTCLSQLGMLGLLQSCRSMYVYPYITPPFYLCA